MADTKISALPAVAAPAVGDEFACNQAGVTKKETKAQITAATDAIHTAHVGAAVLDHPNDSVTDAKLRNSAARSVIGRAAAAGGDPADIVAGADNRLLGRTGGTLAFQQATGGMLGDNIVTNAKIRDSAGTSVIGRAGAGVGDPADIVAGVNDRVLSQAGGTLAFRQVSTAMVAANAATDTIIRDSAARSVIGRAAAAGGDPADIVAGADDRLLARTGGTLAFQPLTVGMVPGGIITATEIANRTRKFFVACGDAYNTTDATRVIGTDWRGWEFVDSKICTGWSFWQVPEDFASGMTVQAVVVPLATANIYSEIEVWYGQCGQLFSTHSDTIGLAAVAVTNNFNNCIQAIAVTNAAVGDILRLHFTRDAINVLDTLGVSAYLAGFIIEYTADS